MSKRSMYPLRTYKYPNKLHTHTRKWSGQNQSKQTCGQNKQKHTSIEPRNTTAGCSQEKHTYSEMVHGKAMGYNKQPANQPTKRPTDRATWFTMIHRNSQRTSIITNDHQPTFNHHHQLIIGQSTNHPKYLGKTKHAETSNQLWTISKPVIKEISMISCSFSISPRYDPNNGCTQPESSMSWTKVIHQKYTKAQNWWAFPRDFL